MSGEVTAAATAIQATGEAIRTAPFLVGLKDFATANPITAAVAATVTVGFAGYGLYKAGSALFNSDPVILVGK